MKNQLFEAFNNGQLILSEKATDFSQLIWNQHPTFEGVELKHLVTASDTNGAFSYHLVRIAPNKSILKHIHETQLETHEIISGNGICINNGYETSYVPGVISIMPKAIPHEVHAGNEGLLLFAKFIPALC